MLSKYAQAMYGHIAAIGPVTEHTINVFMDSQFQISAGDLDLAWDELDEYIELYDDNISWIVTSKRAS